MNDQTELEQIDALKAWWSENGWFVIGGVVLGSALLMGWNYFQSTLQATRTEASALYEQVMTAVQDGDLDSAEVAAQNVIDNYQSTVYPDQTRLALARLYMDKGRDQDAVDVLRPLTADSDDDPSEVQLVGRLRLARVLLYQNKSDEVVGLLVGFDAGAFAARYSEVLGDAYTLQGHYDEARDAYTAALSEAAAGGVPTVDTALVQLKINDLPDPEEMAAVQEAIEAAAATDAAAEPAAEEMTAGDMPAAEDADADDADADDADADDALPAEAPPENDQ